MICGMYGYVYRVLLLADCLQYRMILVIPLPGLDMLDKWSFQSRVIVRQIFRVIEVPMGVHLRIDMMW